MNDEASSGLSAGILRTEYSVPSRITGCCTRPVLGPHQPCRHQIAGIAILDRDMTAAWRKHRTPLGTRLHSTWIFTAYSPDTRLRVELYSSARKARQSCRQCEDIT